MNGGLTDMAVRELPEIEDMIAQAPQPPVKSTSLVDDLDFQLIQATLQGNPQSFGQLVLRHQPSLLFMVHRHLRQREEAEDVVAHVFIKAYQHLGSFRGEAKFFTWLYTIALNLVRNHVRQKKLRRMDSLDVSRRTEEGRALEWPDKSPSPEDILSHRWDVERVKAALEKLTDPQRSIFIQHYFQHLSLKEVALRIKRPVGTVKVYLHRARKMILSELEGEMEMDVKGSAR